ncbi:MAG: carbohydrate porin [Cyanobacteria bacterium SBLK]|nr:carbohydrate porin [Cyanobacteria bacterium SBLK]
MDRQLRILQLLNNPAVLGMALTLASASGTRAMESGIVPDSSNIEIERTDRILKDKEKTLFSFPNSLASEILTNDDFSETDIAREIEPIALQTEELDSEWENLDELVGMEDDYRVEPEEAIANSREEIPLEESRERAEKLPEFLTEEDVFVSSKETREERETSSQTWPEFLTDEDIQRDLSPTNIRRESPSLKAEKTIAPLSLSPEIAIASVEELTPENIARETISDLQTSAELTPLPEPNNLGDLLDRINRYSTEPMGQGNIGAAQFRDVSPGDWAFNALDDLVRRYDCIKGYPNGTYRGNRSLTRYEFAAGLNACIQQVERLLAAATVDFVAQQDLEMIQRLTQEFETELATLSTRVDNLEDRVAFLEAHQFSTTTKLSGEVIFALTDNFDGGSSVTNEILTVVSEMAFGGRARLNFNTSFTGRDRLVTRLRAGNIQAYRSGSLSFLNNTSSFAATQTFNVPDSESNNDVLLDWLGYYFQTGDLQAYVAASGGNWSHIAPTLNPYFEDFDGGNGSLSTFGQRNPIFRIGGGSGAAISWGFTPIKSAPPSTITLGYFAGSNASISGEGFGVFNGDYGAMGRLQANLSDRISLGLTYIHGYHAAGSPIYAEGRSRTSGLNALVGSYAANNPWVLLDNNDGGVPMVTNSYGGEISVRITDGLIVNGAMTYTNTILLERGNADIWSYSLGIALPDFLKEGSVLALYAGMQPTMKGIRASGLQRDLGRTDPIWHLEGFYRFPLTDNISFTPGAVVVFNPNQNFSDHDDVIGTFRFTFSF